MSNLTPVFGIILILVVLPLGLLLARDWLARPSRKKLEEYSRRFEQRLQRPDFAAVEQHFGGPLPSCVKALYGNQQELMRDNFEVARSADAPRPERWFIAFYQPADGEAVSDSWPGQEGYFAFADDGCGNGYLIRPGDEDPPVLFHDHETGEFSRVADRFTEFMRWPRLTGGE